MGHAATSSADVQLAALVAMVRTEARKMIARLPASVELDDLVQAGMLGLWDAMQRFDATQGAQLETFAVQRVRGAMLDELRQMDWMSRRDRREQRRIDAAVHRLEQRFGRTPSQGETARELGLSLTDFQELVGRVIGAQLVYLEDMSGDDGDEDFLSRYSNECCESLEDRMLAKERAEAVSSAWCELPQRLRSVLEGVFEREETLTEVGQELHISVSRACQMQQQALQQITKLVARREMPKATALRTVQEPEEVSPARWPSRWPPEPALSI